MLKRTTAVAGLKGGCGRTTTVAALGGILNARGGKVLLVDLDARGNLTRTFFGDSSVFAGKSIYEAFKRRGRVPAYPCPGHDGLDIVPATISACAIDSEFCRRPDYNFHLKNLLSQVEGDYDHILIDCPGNPGVALANAVVAADGVLYPCVADAFSVAGLLDFRAFLDICRNVNPDATLDGVFLTRFNPRRSMDSVVPRTLREESEGAFLDTVIRECSAFGQAAASGLDILSYSPDCNGTADYLRLLNEIINRQNN